MTLPAMRDQLTVTPYNGEGALGPVYDAQQRTESAYVETGIYQVPNNNGEVTVASLFAIVGPSSTLKVKDQIAFNGVQYEAVKVDGLRSFGVAHHFEVYAKSIGAA